MTAPVYLCPDHHYQTDQPCPQCGERLERLLTGSQRRQLSKFMSGALRHFPADAGLSLDEHGWVGAEELIGTVADRYEWAGRRAVHAVVAVDPKGRFEHRDGRIRATYGHSVDVRIDRDSDAPIPGTLYHGTAPENLESIEAEGLLPMGRQAVHLTDSESEARAVGQRHSDAPVVLRIDTAQLRAANVDISKAGAFIYTVDHVPPGCIENLSG